MMRARLAATLAMMALACTGKANAEPITFTVSANITGTLDGTNINGQVVTFEVTTDTTDVKAIPAGNGVTGYYVTTPAGAVTVSVAGGISDTLSDSITVLDDQTGLGSPTFELFDSSNGHTPISTSDNAFSTYGLTTAIGAITDSAYESSTGESLKTGSGSLVISSIDGNSTVSATMISPAGVVPEPSSLVLTGLAGALALVGHRVRRNRAAARS